ncbi:MAG TPA: histidinol dehydrogenase, partial [Gemmataceae bacterium]
MPPLKIRRIDWSAPRAAQQLAALRELFTDPGDAQPLSARDRKLSQAAFGEVLTPARAVERICTDVRDQGVKAVLRYTEQFDRAKLTPETLRVPEEELARALAEADPEFVETVRAVRERVMSFQLGILHTSAVLPVMGQSELHLRYRPMRRVGVCVPGGAAAYPSTLLMTVCPAQAAGVREIAVVMPPTPLGAYNPDLLAVCEILGVKEVYRMGGAQAVAALAYGVEGVPPVDMIVGPGNLYVTLAKKFVSGRVGIDCLAGPSEIVVAADSAAQPAFVAGDLIAQAEHSADAKAVLVTWHEPLLDAVQQELERQLRRLPRGELARESLAKYGALVLT